MHCIACQTPLIIGCISDSNNVKREKKKKKKKDLLTRKKDSQCYGTLFTYSKCANIRAVLIWVFIANITAESWRIFLTDIHIWISLVLQWKNQTPTKLHYWIYKKSIYKIQKQCFDRVNLEETTIPFFFGNGMTNLCDSGTKTCVHKHGKKMALDQNGRKQPGKFLIQNTSWSTQTWNTCVGKCIY